MSNAALDKKILLPTIAIVLLTSAPLIFYASSLQGMIQSIYDFTAKSFGWGYILLYLLGGFFVFFIAFSPYGKIKLGGHDQKPVFNNFHWGSMIIAAGHGIGMVNWSMVEPLITNNAAPLGHGANAAYSYEVATAYTFFHWGPYYWVLYLIPCIPIFYFMGVRQVKKQRVSECLTPLFGRKLIDGWFGVCHDVFIIMGLAGGIGSTLATAVQLVSGLYADYFGLPDTQALHLGVLGMFTVITLGSIRKPLSKGMRLLSDMNSILALSLLAIVLIGGATGYFFSLGTNTLGMVLDMFPRVSGWTDPFNASGFPAKWTVFYGAWFLAYGPMMAIFFTGISMGRTLRETVLGVYFFGCLSSFLFSVIFGGFSLYLQYTGQFDVYAFYLANGLPNTVSKVVSLTPLHLPGLPHLLYDLPYDHHRRGDPSHGLHVFQGNPQRSGTQRHFKVHLVHFSFHTRLGRPACRRAGNHPSAGRFGRHPPPRHLRYHEHLHVQGRTRRFSKHMGSKPALYR